MMQKCSHSICVSYLLHKTNNLAHPGCPDALLITISASTDFSQKYADLLQTLSLALAPDLIFQRLRFKGAVAVRLIVKQPDVNKGFHLVNMVVFTTIL